VAVASSSVEDPKRGADSVAEQWFEPDDARRYAALLGQMMLVVAIVMMSLGAIAWGSLSRRIELNEWSEDRNLSAGIAAAAPDQQAELAAAAGREAIVVDPATTTLIVSETLPNQAKRRWLDRLGARVRNTGPSQFTSTDPNGTTWWITAAPAKDGCCLVLLRRASSALASVSTVRLWIAALGAAMLTGLGLLYFALTRRMRSVTQALLDASEDLRLRGAIRPAVRRRLDRVPSRPLEFKRLAHSIDSIENDARRSFDQLDSLLHAAATLGGSLDQQVVLENILEQLEQVLGAPQSTILSWDSHLGHFEVLATRGHTDSYISAITTREFDPTLPSVIALREQVPIQVSDTQSEVVAMGLAKRGRAHGYRSIMAVPLPATSERQTVLVLHKPDPYTYSHDEIILSESFAGLAAAALGNAELYAQIDQDLQQKSRELSAIVESVEQGILVQSAGGDVIYANSTMLAFLPEHTSFEDGMSSSQFLDAMFAGAVDPVSARNAVEDLRQNTNHWAEIDLFRHDGTVSTLRVRTFAVTDSVGRPLGEGQVWTDVTDDRALDRMKSGLLATVSHEFRTPLALIKGYATTLLADDVDWIETDRTEFLRLVAAEADRLAELVQRLLDMRRIDAGMVELQRLPVETDEIVDAAIQGVHGSRGRVIVEPISPVVVSVDRPRIVTALRNLVSNACTYSPGDATVVVSVTSSPESVRFSVADRGIGVPDQLKGRVFDTFVRADASRTTERRGIGLGLAITRGFVEAHGGHVWVEDQPEGPGSVFRMSIPLNPDGETAIGESDDLSAIGANR